MSEFYVSQRVRIVLQRTSMFGRECTVIGLGVQGKDLGRPFVGIQVDIPHSFFGFCVYEPEDLEPILPPGLESPSEIAALYEPEPVST